MTETSILILAKNEDRNIGNCLEAIYAQEGTGSFEVILVDSGSTDRTIEIASQYPVRIYRILPEEFHHAKTRNVAASLAQGEYLVYLAADAIPASNSWLVSLIADFADGDVGAVYGRHLPKAGSNAERQAVLGTVYGDLRIVKELSRKSELGFRYYHFSTVNAAIRKAVWNETPFPEDLKVFEDIGIAKRLLDKGWKIIYEPNAVVYHSHNHTTSGLFKRYFDLGVIWKKLEISTRETRRSTIREGCKLLWERVRKPKSNGQSMAGGRMIHQEVAKYAGLLLGLNERFIPAHVKKHLSAFHLFE